MERFKLYCTESQTLKALELGAPIRTEINFTRTGTQFEGIYNDGKTFYYLPTAEEMIGWLEEQDIIEEIDVSIYEGDKWAQRVHLNNKPALIDYTLFDSRKTATLAAIDAALEYLISNKK